MDPHVLRLVRPITEYSATRGSSGFSKEPWPGMDPFDQLLDLRQGSSSIEEYVTHFCEKSYRVPLMRSYIKGTFFVLDLMSPLQSCLPEGSLIVV